MYHYKLPNASAHQITVTSTATKLFALIDTAAGEAAELPGLLNAVFLSVEDGDIRVTFDGTDPTADAGLLMSSGSRTYFSGVPLSKMKMIRAGGSDVSVSLEVGQSEKGEASVMSGSGGGAASGAEVVTDGDTVTPGSSDGALMAGMVDDTATATVAEGDAGIVRISPRRAIKTDMDTLMFGEDAANGLMAVAEKPTAVATYAPDSDVSSALEASSVVKATPGVLYGFTASNTNAAIRYLQFFNSATVPADTTVPVMEFAIPLEGTIDINFPQGRYFSVGISWAISSTNGAKTIGAAEALAWVAYK